MPGITVLVIFINAIDSHTENAPGTILNIFTKIIRCNNNKNSVPKQNKSLTVKQSKPIDYISTTHPNPSPSSDESIDTNTLSYQHIPSKVLDKNEYVPINDEEMDTDFKDFIIIPRPIPFACTVTIQKSAKELPTNSIIKAINEKFTKDDAFKGLTSVTSILLD